MLRAPSNWPTGSGRVALAVAMRPSLAGRATEADFVPVGIEKERAAAVFGEVLGRLDASRAGRATKVAAEQALEGYSVHHQPKAGTEQVKQSFEALQRQFFHAADYAPGASGVNPA